MEEDIDKLLTFNPERAEKVINDVFAEERNEAPRYNPFFLLQNEDGLIEKAIDSDYQNSAALKNLTIR